MAAGLPNLEQNWTEAPLIPVLGLKGSRDKELRSTAALLAVMRAVPSFGHRILRYFGAPRGRITAFTEPRFETEAGGTARPDGAIVVERGTKRWVYLVEVKTGTAHLKDDQVDLYLRIANREGFDGLLTVSNQLVASPEESPVNVDGRRLRKLRLRHLSWFRILTEAVIEHEHRGVNDPDQAWILGELIKYLDDERSGASGFLDMGPKWVAVRAAAKNRTLGTTDAEVAEIASSWEQYVEYLSLKLRQNLGRRVAPVYGSKSDRAARQRVHIDSLGNHARLDATIRIPDAAGPIDIRADLAARVVRTQCRVQAPKDERRARTQINWLLRQLRTAPPGVTVEVHYPRTRTSMSLLVSDAFDRVGDLLLPDDVSRRPNAFTVALTRDMGKKKGKLQGSFVHETMKQTLEFYGEVVQKIQKWTPPPPKLTPEPDEEANPGDLVAGISAEEPDH